jgi:hypothetical protein
VVNYSALLWFFGSFVVSMLVTRWLLDRRAKRLEAERIKAEKNAEAFSELIRASLRSRLQHQMLMAQIEASSRRAQMEYEAAYADECARAAMREGSLESSCIEVAAKKRLH